MYLKSVREFLDKYEHKISNKPGLQSPKIRKFWQDMIMEEANETHVALKDNDLVAIADGIADLLYVTFGTALAYGIPIKEVFKEVHRSNMTKPMKKNKHGKIMKGDYSPADIEEILDKYIS